MDKKTKKQKNRNEKNTSLEVSAMQTILSGGSVILADGRIITSSNVPESYSEAVRQGISFYIDRLSA